MTWVLSGNIRGPQGVQGSDGKTILYGAGAPANGTGANGDFYIDTAAHTIYGPKSAGVWPAGASLIGPVGPPGDAGTDGNTILYGTAAPTTEGVNGDFYIRTTTSMLYGPKSSGTWPAGTSLIGPQGPEGPAGSLEGMTASHINTALGYTAANAANIPANTGELTEGSNLYFTAARVRSTVLTGLSTAAATIVDATHTVLEAIGFLQKQVSDNLVTLTSHTGNTSNPHSVTKTQVGLGNVDNTSDANKPVSTATQTALDAKVAGPASSVNDRVAFFDGTTGKLIKDSGLTLSGTNTGNETATSIGALVNGATDKATPVDADYVGLMDSAASNVLKKLSWANIKATLKTYFDTLYGNVTTTGVQTLTNKTLTAPTLTGYTETVYALSGTVIDPANGTVQTKTLSGNTTFTKSIADGQSVVLMLNPATYAVTWMTVSWVNAAGTGAAPTLKASAMNVIVLWQVGGVLYGNWIGSL